MSLYSAMTEPTVRVKPDTVLKLHLKRKPNRPRVEKRRHIVEVRADGAGARQRDAGRCGENRIAVRHVEQIDLAGKALAPPPDILFQIHVELEEPRIVQ